MLSWSRAALSLLALLSIVGPARSEGLVQLTLNGEIASKGGAMVELHVGFWDGNKTVPVDLRLHLADRTSASDVGHLLVSRLRAAGAKVLYPGEGNPRSELAQILIEDITLLSYRLERGLWATVTICEQGPESVSFQPPLELPGKAELSICTTTFHPHTKKPGRITLELETTAESTAASVCQQLFEQGLERGLVGDRPTSSQWRAVRTSMGAEVAGCSITLRSGSADWGLEVKLPVPQE